MFCAHAYQAQYYYVASKQINIIGSAGIGDHPCFFNFYGPYLVVKFPIFLRLHLNICNADFHLNALHISCCISIRCFVITKMRSMFCDQEVGVCTNYVSILTGRTVYKH